MAVSVLAAALLLMGGLAGWLRPSFVGPVAHIAVMALPVTLAATIVCAVAWAVARRWRVTLPLVAVVAVTAPAWLNVCPLHTGPKSTEKADFTIMTFNAASFEFTNKALRRKPSENVRMIMRHSPDFVVLQDVYTCRMMYYEMHSVWFVRDSLFAMYPYRSDGHDRVILLSKYPFVKRDIVVPYIKFTGGEIPRDLYHHWAVAYDVTMPDGHQLTIIGAQLASYMLSDDERQLYSSTMSGTLSKSQASPLDILGKIAAADRWRGVQARVLRDVIDNSAKNLIVCGDFNDVPASPVYRLLRGRDLRDARTETTAGLCPTYNRQHFNFTIDHILYRGSLDATSYQNIHEGTSDHYPQLAHFKWQ